MPPPLATWDKKFTCSGVIPVRWPLVSMAVKTAIFCPTISGVTVTGTQPIKSDDPTQSPNFTGTAPWMVTVLPCLDFLPIHAKPTLLRKTRAPQVVASNMIWRMKSDSSINKAPLVVVSHSFRRIPCLTRSPCTHSLLASPRCPSFPRH